MPDIDIKIKDVRRGNARYRQGGYRITIPQWAMANGWYGIYYIVHELAHIVCHQLFNHMGHTEEFKMIEDAYLADFGLKVQRKKAYPKALVAFGQVVYSA
jgi:hypothetical protein